MNRPRVTTLLVLPFVFSFGFAVFGVSQTVPTSKPADQPAQPLSAQAAPASQQSNSTASAIPANAPRISKGNRYEILRNFETQLVYVRTPFPMGTKGLKLQDGTITPNGQELQQELALWGPSVRPGDPAHISFIQIKSDHIHFELNGGPVRRKKWYQHIEISGANGGGMGGPNAPQENPHGSCVDLYFDHYVPDMTSQQLRDLLYPVLDFNAKNKEQAYLDTVPPKVKEAILAHHVLVGMNPEMVVHAKGRPSKKVREKDGDTDYEEWIYGEPPQDVDFVRIVGEEVVRVETMKVDGQKIVRTEKEVQIDQPQREAKQQEPVDRPVDAPSLRRPGEDSEDVPKSDDGRGTAPGPVVPPPDMPTPSGPPGPGSAVGTGL